MEIPFTDIHRKVTECVPGAVSFQLQNESGQARLLGRFNVNQAQQLVRAAARHPTITIKRTKHGSTLIEGNATHIHAAMMDAFPTGPSTTKSA